MRGHRTALRCSGPTRTPRIVERPGGRSSGGHSREPIAAMYLASQQVQQGPHSARRGGAPVGLGAAELALALLRHEVPLPVRHVDGA